jgi:hypothetical protein
LLLLMLLLLLLLVLLNLLLLHLHLHLLLLLLLLLEMGCLLVLVILRLSVLLHHANQRAKIFGIRHIQPVLRCDRRTKRLLCTSRRPYRIERRRRQA